MKGYIITILYFVLSLATYSQNNPSGYVIKNNHDTVQGYFKDVETESLSEKVQFKANLNEDWTSFLPGDIQKFEITGKALFKTVTYIDILDSNKSKTVFGKILMEGYYNLYGIYISGKTYYFVQGTSDQGWLLYNDEFSTNEL